MSPRELTILLLGLAIVGLILRGLYLAMQARRGQIRLAIDKRLPQDVNLDELEMSELPRGGARVVSRDARSTGAVDRAQARARDRDLAGDDEEQIPVLMDAVSVNGPTQSERDSEQSEVPDTGVMASADVEPAEDPDDILLDYFETTGFETTEPEKTGDETEPAMDNMASVRPDYDGQPEVAAAEEQAGEYGHADIELEQEDFDEEVIREKEPEKEEIEGEVEKSGSFEDSLENFSLSAGDRIGFEEGTTSSPKPTLKAVEQDGLFDDLDETQDAGKANEAKQPPTKRKSLFSTFGRKKSEATEPESQHRPRDESATRAPAGIDDDIDTTGEIAAMEPATSFQPSEVLVINLMAPEGHAFAGDALLQVLITAGLKFGDMQIFHKRLGSDSKGPVIFSVANILNPGSFDLNSMDEFTTVGITFFLAMPTPINNLDAFEDMLATARDIQAQLGAELKDDNRNVMTAQTIEHYRERIRDFELRQLKAAGSRG